jgi:Transglutaminase-like superfamily
VGSRLALSRARRLARLLTPSNVRAAAWAFVALRRARRDLAAEGLDGARVGRPPRLPASARAGVLAVVRRGPSTCLERALVLQRWEAEHGAGGDVIIGVRGPGDGFRAHAWLETMPDGPPGTFEEILRLPAPTH